MRMGLLMAALAGATSLSSRAEASCGGGGPSVPSVPSVPAMPTGKAGPGVTATDVKPARAKYWWVSLVAVGGAALVFGTVFGVLSAKSDSGSSSTSSGLTVHF